MAIGLNPITVADAGPVMARAMGLSWDSDRKEVIDYLNKYRLLLYTSYEKFKLFDNSFHKISVQQFDGYQGFTLPSDISGVEAVWSCGQPLLLRSRWREAHTGVGVSGLGRIEAVTLAEGFATERDMNAVTKLKIFTEHEADANKKVHVEVVDAANRQKRISFTLIHDGFAVSRIRVKRVLSVSMPSGRCGSLTLMQQDGHELSTYTPWESVPFYLRLKVKDQSSPGTVIVQGTKRFQNVYFDHDIVEVGNALIIEAAGKFFKYGESTTDAKELQTAEYHRNLMEKYLKGEIARHRGNTIQDGSPFKGARITKKASLPGYR